MELRHNPLEIFNGSNTPAGLYARQRWLGEEQEDRWQADFNETVASLSAGQGAEGSWNRSPAETVERLFGLHLTVREPDARIKKGMAWLLSRLELPSPKSGSRLPPDRISPSGDWKNLPFMAAGGNLWTAATLFLAGIFNMAHDPVVLEAYRLIAEEGIISRGQWKDAASANNVLRALVVHPLYKHHVAVTLAVETLAERQLPNGLWPPPIPFYQTLNALGHLDLPEAASQLERAFTHLIEIQRPDGSWGDSQPEWNTFLAVHALKNRGILPA